MVVTRRSLRHCGRIAPTLDPRPALRRSADGGAIPTPEIYRAKGVLHVAGSPAMHTLQAVRGTYELAAGAAWEGADQGATDAAGERLNRLVFIGRNLDRAMLRGALLQCRAVV